jgi:hypothetical protein
VSDATGPPTEAARFEQSVPLGGSAPVPVESVRRSDRGPVVLTAILLLAAVLCGVASSLVWRDFGRIVVRSESTGWALADGTVGRGWVAILLGIGFAVAGVLVAAERERAGRILAVVVGISAIVFSVIEWGLGDGASRTGPGPGLWLLSGVGFVVVLAVGVIRPAAAAIEDGRTTSAR